LHKVKTIPLQQLVADIVVVNIEVCFSRTKKVRLLHENISFSKISYKIKQNLLFVLQNLFIQLFVSIIF